MPLYQGKFPRGTPVRINSREALAAFQHGWRLHHPLSDDMLAFAGHAATVTSVAFYHGGDVLYQLGGIPGTWHEVCLAPAFTRARLAVRLLATHLGGRALPISLEGSLWRPHLKTSSSEMLGVAFISGPSAMPPGTSCEAVVEFIYADNGLDYSPLATGTIADILEGPNVVGQARVLELLP